MRTGIAGTEHTENNTEGNTVKFCANQIVITQNEETKHAGGPGTNSSPMIWAQVFSAGYI
jgi:hypothetical protein